MDGRGDYNGYVDGSWIRGCVGEEWTPEERLIREKKKAQRQDSWHVDVFITEVPNLFGSEFVVSGWSYDGVWSFEFLAETYAEAEALMWEKLEDDMHFWPMEERVDNLTLRDIGEEE